MSGDGEMKRWQKMRRRRAVKWRKRNSYESEISYGENMARSAENMAMGGSIRRKSAIEGENHLISGHSKAVRKMRVGAVGDARIWRKKNNINGISSK